MNTSRLIAVRFVIGNPDNSLLGRSGMGVVYRAKDIQMGEDGAPLRR